MKHHVSFDIEFRKNNTKGFYIAFEGIDGVGKTTQANILKSHLEKMGKSVAVTKEPTDKPPVGNLIHDFIKGEIKIPAVAIQYLFAADREIHQKEFIEPALEKGDIVVSDRSFWSSIAYGILDKKEDFSKLSNKDVLLVSESILSMYHQFIVPDITFYIKAKPETAFARLSAMGRKTEYYETLEKLQNISAGYDWLSEKFPEEIVVVDGEVPVEKVSSEILKKVEEKL